MKIEVKGKLSPHVTSKDVILYIIAQQRLIKNMALVRSNPPLSTTFGAIGLG